ncbi:hypothetical protein [Paraburkholderia tagetis]|uniref:Uncharacterized protein n=1 Tax=Paraburkholderia tagetis TaxID=2913261 RepID=A0A9X1UN44_9BURK|nr:hypothetical protein [Paraburkholderia tagetis]MCG5078503.1 hypothetical protein [Paraburkholderia tagetis]
MMSEETVLTIAAYDGKYTGSLDLLAHLFDLDGSVVPYDRPPFSVLEEALKVLELCADKYSTPRPNGEYLSVLIGRKCGSETEPLARLDIRVKNGLARASIVAGDTASAETAAVVVDTDDVATIVRKVLQQHLSRNES